MGLKEEGRGAEGEGEWEGSLYLGRMTLRIQIVLLVGEKVQID